MALRKIALVGHPILRQTARKLSLEELCSLDTQRFIDDLIDTMRDANGAGLAAPQVYESVMVCAIEVKSNPRYPYKPDIPLTVLVNPELEFLSDACFDNYEGCLSVPNLRGVVSRHAELRVRALDRHGAPIDTIVRGITAGTYQHEIDHLYGKLFVDRVTDPTTFSTWAEFERYRMADFVTYARGVVSRYGS